MPASARMLREPGETLVFTSVPLDSERARHLQAAGAQVRHVPIDTHGDGRLDMQAVLRELGANMCNDVLVEAGSTLSGWLLERGLVDELVVYVAPKVLGSDARPMLQLTGLDSLNLAPQFELFDVQRFGADLKLVYRPVAN
jgi:diaminohydroxyphosphoribosylaminopyrimidine deaminase/5-amino-6-(5-phosphoribosylamino)uracil reductase